MEINTGVGDIIDTSLDVMKIANLNRLRVQCQVYEEDLPSVARAEARRAKMDDPSRRRFQQ